jgi:hypothetical protein
MRELEKEERAKTLLKYLDVHFDECINPQCWLGISYEDLRTLLNWSRDFVERYEFNALDRVVETTEGFEINGDMGTVRPLGVIQTWESVLISNSGIDTKVFFDGVEVEKVTSVSFEHRVGYEPVVKIVQLKEMENTDVS